MKLAIILNPQRRNRIDMRFLFLPPVTSRVTGLVLPPAGKDFGAGGRAIKFNNGEKRELAKS